MTGDELFTPAPDVAPIYVDWTSFWARDRTEPEWLLEPILARGRGHAIYASHKTGKSLLTLWAALQVVRAGAVAIYLDYEMGEDDLYERLEDMGCGPETDLERLRYALLPSLPPLDTALGAAELLALVDDETARFPDRHIAVIVDTISRAVAGEEDSNDTFRDFYRHTGLGLKQRGVTWVRLDHAGKDLTRGQRGASGKGDDVDVIWRLADAEDGLELKRDAARMGWVPTKVPLEKITDPELAFRVKSMGWPAGTCETAEDLAALAVPMGATTAEAQDALKRAGKGRRRAVVVAAVRYRQERSERREPPREPHSPIPREPMPGTADRIPHNHGQEPHPELPGTDSRGHREPGSPPIGGTGPRPGAEPDDIPAEFRGGAS